MRGEYICTACDRKQLIAEAVHPPDSEIESPWKEIFGNGIYSILHDVCIITFSVSYFTEELSEQMCALKKQ